MFQIGLQPPVLVHQHCLYNCLL